MQVVLTQNNGRQKTYALAYATSDFTQKTPGARIVKLSDGTFRAEGYSTPAVVATGTLAECYDALRSYGNDALSYGTPDDDWRLLAI
jgi:hypothetical protein